VDLRADVRLVIRRLRSAPGYTLACVGILSLAIAASSATFSTLYAILLSPLPVHRPADLVVVWQTSPARKLPVVEVTYRTVEKWALSSRSFVRVAGMGSSTWPAVLQGRGDPARIAIAGVSANFFETLGAFPLVGRTLRPDDDVQNAARVAILSWGIWTRRFGGDPQVLGTTVSVDRRPHTIVGVMPKDFDFPRGADLWTAVTPILTANAAPDFDVLSRVGVLYAVGRLREGVTPTAAAQELSALSGQPGEPSTDVRAVVTPFLDYVVGPVRRQLWALFAAVLALLLIACSNVSTLMMTRVTLRRRDAAIRLALGASPFRLARLWLVEVSIIALLGGTIGIWAASVLARLIVLLAPSDVPRLANVGFNGAVAVFTFIVVVVCALLVGVIPALRAARSNAQGELVAAGRGILGPTSHGTRSILTVFQIATAVVLLVAMGLLVRSFVNLRRVDLGFVPSNVLTLEIDPQVPPTERTLLLGKNEWIHEFLTRLNSAPGVVSAGAVYLRPLSHGPIGQEIWTLLDEQPDTAVARQQNPLLNYQVATPGYFSAMRIALRRGRLFTANDNATAPRVAVVSESTARRLWPDQDPIGKRFLTTSFVPAPRTAWRTVIGVVDDVRYRGLDDPRLDVYDAALQSHDTARDVVVRTDGDPRGLVGVVRGVAAAIDRSVLIDRISTMDEVVLQATAPWRLAVWAFSVFGVLAFILAMFGLFTLISFDVAHRKQEYAVRLALGAPQPVILRTVMAMAGRRVLAGLTLGLVSAAAATSAIRTLTFHVAPVDPLTYGSVTVTVLLVVAVASYVPARRAAAIDPVHLLKTE